MISPSLKLRVQKEIFMSALRTNNVIAKCLKMERKILKPTNSDKDNIETTGISRIHFLQQLNCFRSQSKKSNEFESNMLKTIVNSLGTCLTVPEEEVIS